MQSRLAHAVDSVRGTLEAFKFNEAASELIQICME